MVIAPQKAQGCLFTNHAHPISTHPRPKAAGGMVRQAFVFFTAACECCLRADLQTCTYIHCRAFLGLQIQNFLLDSNISAAMDAYTQRQSIVKSTSHRKHFDGHGQRCQLIPPCPPNTDEKIQQCSKCPTYHDYQNNIPIWMKIKITILQSNYNDDKRPDTVIGSGTRMLVWSSPQATSCDLSIQYHLWHTH